jgi:hypothetical protein
MKTHAVILKVTPCLRLECKFWIGDDGWTGSTEHPPIVLVQPELERRRSPLVSIPPCGRGFSRYRGLSNR